MSVTSICTTDTSNEQTVPQRLGLAVANRAVPKPHPPKLRAVPTPARPTPTRESLDQLESKRLVRLHPKNCRCDFHTYGGLWSLPTKLGKAAPLLRGPSVVAIDLESYLGSPKATATDAAVGFRFLRKALSLTRSDYVIFAMSHYSASKWSFALPTNQASLVLRSGPDGADLALIEATDLRLISRHFANLVIVSNDHIFTDLARQAHALGMTTWNVSSDLSGLAPSTRAAFDGWTHIKLSVIQKNRADRTKAQRKVKLSAVTSTKAPARKEG